MNSSSKRRIVVYDSDRPNLDFADFSVKWNGHEESDNSISILNYIDENKESLKERYVAWVSNLGAYIVKGKSITQHLLIDENFSIWWMSLLFEKSIWKSPGIAQAIRIFALEDILISRKPDMVILVTGNAKLQEVIGTMCQNLGISFEIKPTTGEVKRNLSYKEKYTRLPPFMRALLTLGRYLFLRLNYKKNARANWKTGEKSVFFCSYFFNIDMGKAAAGEFYSQYWHQLPNIINRHGYKANWLQLYIPHDRVRSYRAANGFLKKFNQKNSQDTTHCFHDMYLSVSLVTKVLFQYVRLLYKSFRFQNIKEAFEPQGTHFSLWPILGYDWTDSVTGGVAMNNLMQYALFDKAMSAVPYQEKGFYLLECQAWERALVAAWRKYGHGKLIAIPHSTRSFWDLRFSCSAADTDSYRIPEADYVAVNGNAAKNIFLSEHYELNKLLECEALRYGYLLNQSNSLEMQPRKTEDLLCILILGDYLGSGLVKILEQLQRIHPMLAFPVSYTVKPHPNNKISVNHYIDLDLKIVNDQLGSILQDYDIAYACNTTSASVDAYLAGLQVLISFEEDSLNVSPLMGWPDACFIHSNNELVRILSEISQKPRLVKQQRDFFFLDPFFPRWEKIIGDPLQ